MPKVVKPEIFDPGGPGSRRRKSFSAHRRSACPAPFRNTSVSRLSERSRRARIYLPYRSIHGHVSSLAVLATRDGEYPRLDVHVTPAADQWQFPSHSASEGSVGGSLPPEPTRPLASLAAFRDPPPTVYCIEPRRVVRMADRAGWHASHNAASGRDGADVAQRLLSALVRSRVNGFVAQTGLSSLSEHPRCVAGIGDSVIPARPSPVRLPPILGGSGLADAKAPDPDPNPHCPVCGKAIVDNDIVVFVQRQLIHLDCHWDPPLPRRPLTRAMLWPK